MYNVIFIMSDDQGPWAMGCAGNPEIMTPNLDRIAAEGMRFSNFYCASPVCSPSRATFFTGMMPSRHGVHDHISRGNVPPNSVDYLAGFTSYVDVLAAHGYECGISGKWHLGQSEKPHFSFSHWFVHQLGASDYHNAPMVRNGKLVKEPGYITDVITDDALCFLDLHGRGSAPFYLSVHYTAPHDPWTGHPQDIVDLYDECPFTSCPQEPVHPWAGGWTNECLGNREMLKGYFAAVTAMDANIGRILRKVSELGIDENTLICFFSDNGQSCGLHGFWGKGNGTYPQNMYDVTTKVPAIFRHPGRIPAGRVVDDLASAYDFFPTLLDYLDLPEAGALQPAAPPSGNPLSGGSRLDSGRLPGRSLVPVLLGEKAAEREEVIVFDEYGPVRMIRTNEWKYVHRYPEGPCELYDMVNDPVERRNLIEDPGQKKRVKDLKGRLEEWFDRYSEPEKNGKDLPVKGIGQLMPVPKETDASAAFNPVPAHWFMNYNHDGGGYVPPELKTPNYRIRPVSGIGYDPEVERQDPSNVIKVADTYYVWYTQRNTGVHGYASTIFYAASNDGVWWHDRGQALGKGRSGEWDSFGVITPYVAVADGRYYLYYTGTSDARPFRPNGTLRHIGVAVAESPDGPWLKFSGNPVLSPDKDSYRFDSLLVDDTHVIVRNGEFWLYFKGRSRSLKPDQTKWGLAIADHPTGPFLKYEHNPVLGSGHTVCVWPHRTGVAALVDNAGPERFTVQYAADSIHFKRAAKLDFVHTGCGPYDPDAFSNHPYGRGIEWGAAQHVTNGHVHIIRFDCRLTAPAPGG